MFRLYPCPKCGSVLNEPCKTKGGKIMRTIHANRRLYNNVKRCYKCDGIKDSPNLVAGRNEYEVESCSEPFHEEQNA